MSQNIAPKQTESTLTTKHPINVLWDVMVRSLGLDEDRVNIYNQKFKIPTDDGIFIAIGLLGAKCYRSRSENVVQNSGAYGEALMLNVQESYTIDIYSKSEQAFFRKEEVLMALSSQYCRNKMEQYGFQIARIPKAFNDVSDTEGAARLYRFTTDITVLAWYRKEVAVDYYNSFSTQVRVDSNQQGVNSTQVSFTQNHG